MSSGCLYRFIDAFVFIMVTRRAHVRLRPLIPFLQANARERSRMLANRRIICSLCEVVHNVLKGHVKLSRGQKQRWSRHKHKLRQLVKRTTTSKKRKELIQKGGFISLLLPLATKLLGGLL
ncbi:hypothetical protein BaRGS_00038834 [Batillaria attramentaria]|uniref:Uncharacterized protein n=1 Tax=Batillaria attramentaria TaxID=370345 RepID=A0ABD0J4Z3_9CAEN